jgi:outer membrane protein assembly factor BamA
MVNKDFNIATNGADLIVFWDNRDYPASPSQGNGLSVQVSRDPGKFGSSGSWTNLSAEYDHYISLGATETFRQRVIALAFWTSDSPTWTQNPNGTISNGPPSYAGSTLGGFFRLRAFPSQRFSDKAAIYGTAELRLIPEWNPFNAYPRLQERVGVRWIQFVGFAEVGRVAPEWNLSVLHQDLKWDVGLGIRMWAKGLVVRVDSAVANEGFGVQMMVSQPFQF